MAKREYTSFVFIPPWEERGDKHGDHPDFDQIFDGNHRSPDRSQRTLVDHAYHTRHNRREAVPVV